MRQFCQNIANMFLEKFAMDVVIMFDLSLNKFSYYIPGKTLANNRLNHIQYRMKEISMIQIKNTSLKFLCNKYFTIVCYNLNIISVSSI